MQSGASSQHPASPYRSYEPVAIALLGLVAQEPKHAFTLGRALLARGFKFADHSLVYRRLHDLERRQLVSSSWDMPSSGPARRVYEITDSGWELLASATAANQQEEEIQKRESGAKDST